MLADTGAAARTLEGFLRQTFDARAVLLTDSGTSALTLALRASAASPPIRPVALPAYGCYDLATAADGAGADVLLYDVDTRTLGPNLDSLEAALRGGAGTLVIASLYGMPIDLDSVKELAARHGAVVVEDAAQAVGMTWRDRPAGSTGSFGVLSFGRGKGVTGGGGGALLLNDAAAAAALSLLAVGEMRSPRGLKAALGLLAQWALARPEIYALPASLPLGLGETRYRPPAPTGGASAASCAAVLRTLPLGLAEVAARRRNATRLLEAAEQGLRFRAIQVVTGGNPSFLRLPLVASDGTAPFSDRGAAALGVMPGYPLALCDLPGFANRVRNSSAAFTGARRLAARLGTLPTHSRLSEPDLERLEAWVRRAG
jgi:dTDP-4-amino-4,6-dideoxygalactose transaminase